MVLRVDTYHHSYRLSLYAPFWILNRTDLKLELQVEKFPCFFVDFDFVSFHRLRLIDRLLMLQKHHI